MRPREVKESLKRLITIKRPAFLWGSPGIYKSDVVRQVADELYGGKVIYQRNDNRAHLRDIRALLLDPVDLRGIPHINGDGQAHWCPPEFLPKEGSGVLFLDELPSAPPLVQNSCLQLVLDRRLGEYRLPDGWAIIAAGNRETDRAITHRMPTPVANRFIHIQCDVNVDDFHDWGLVNGIHPSVLAFLHKWRPALLCNFDPKRNEKSFATPRTWEFVSNIISGTTLDPNIEYELLQGTVGEGAAAEFLGFLKVYRNLPDPKDVLAEPEKAKIPKDPATLYALCGAVANIATHKDAKNLFALANRLPDEFGVLLTVDTVHRDKERRILSTAPFIEWAAKHKDVLV